MPGVLVPQRAAHKRAWLMRLPGGRLSREEMTRMTMPEFLRHCRWIQRREMIRASLFYVVFLSFLAAFYWSTGR